MANDDFHAAYDDSFFHTTAPHGKGSWLPCEGLGCVQPVLPPSCSITFFNF